MHYKPLIQTKSFKQACLGDKIFISKRVDRLLVDNYSQCKLHGTYNAVEFREN